MLNQSLQMVDMTRRQWLKVTASSVVIGLCGGLETIVGKETFAAESGKKSTITFEQALHNPADREKYVHELLVGLFSEDIVDKYVAGVRYFDTIAAYLKEYPPAGIRDIEGLTQARFASLFQYTKFGNDAKSHIIAFPRAFNNKIVDFGNVKVFVKSSEELIKGDLVHEFKHAIDRYHGIRLPNGSEINANNFQRINSDVAEFVEESRAYIEEMVYKKNTISMEQPHVLRLQIDKLPPSYVDSIKAFVSKLEKLDSKISPKLLTPDEHKLMEGQLTEIVLKLPELSIIGSLRNLYNKFNIR